jgi:hypothetical protein
MQFSGSLLRIGTALAAAVLTGLTVVSAGPAWAEEQAVIDVLKIVDGEYLVETVTVPARTAEARADQLEAEPEVVAASPSVVYQVAGYDPYWDTTDPQEKSAVKDVWSRTRGEGQIVAVLDSAFDTTHPDLAGAFVPGTEMITGPGANWHGTGVAGIVAARAENNIGSAGMAPEARVMPIRVCNDTGCPSAGIARGIFWAVDHGADVINMSLSGAGYSSVTAVAVRYALDKNISVVASAGNDGLNGNWVGYPAGHSGVISVSSTAPDGTPSNWAQHNWSVDISTVGDSTMLTMPGGGYGSGSGTSFSGPAVAGAVALLRSAVPGITPEQVQAALEAGVDSSAGWDRAYGAGRLHVPSALAAADRADLGVAVAPGPGAVSVSWPAVPGAGSYAVRIDGTVRAEVGGTSATVSGLTDGTQVAVDVQPSNGDRSRAVLATVGPAAPSVPVLHSASLSGSVVTFSASTSVPALRYSIDLDGASIGSVPLAMTSTPKTFSVNIGTTPTTQKRLQLRGADDYGRTSAASNAVVVGSGVPAPPGAVTGLAGLIDGDDVLLTWDDLGSTITYRVSADGTTLATPTTAGAVVPAPAAGASRSYSVVAVDAWNQAGPVATTTVTGVAAPQKPVAGVAPAVVGTPRVGQVVTSPDTWTGADTVVREWYACDTTCQLLSAGDSHTVQQGSVGRRLEVRVAATNAVGVTRAISARSGVVEASVVSVPGTPVLRTVAPGDGQATVTWLPPAQTGGGAITGFQVETWAGNALVGTTTLGYATGTVVGGLTNGTAYTFTVAARNAAGYGAATARSTPVTPHAVPGAPDFAQLTPGNGSVTVRWSAPGSDGGGAITDYRLRVYAGGALFRETFYGNGLGGPVTGLTNGTAYTFQIAAANDVGYGPSTTSAPVTPRTAPSAPRIGTPTAQAGSAVVRWAAPASDGGSPVLGYVVRAYRGTTLVRTATANGAATSATVTGLVNGSAHTFIVTASNALGQSPFSARSAAVTPRDRPSPPRVYTPTPGNGSATVRWLPPVSNGGATVTNYVVRTYRGTVMIKQTVVTSRTTALLVSGLTNGLRYTVTVSAVNAVGWSAPSVVLPVVPRR